MSEESRPPENATAKSLLQQWEAIQRERVALQEERLQLEEVPRRLEQERSELQKAQDRLQEAQDRLQEERERIQAEEARLVSERCLMTTQLLNAVEQEYGKAILQSSKPTLTPQEFRGLYGEVVIEDTYGLRELDFAPDVILDVGACIGVFSRFARELFPAAQIIALEPHPWNFYNLLLLTPECFRIEARNCAFGNGPVWQVIHDGNGSSQCYLSVAPGCSSESMQARSDCVLSEVDTISLPDLLKPWNGKTILLKMDCEGGENALYGHASSLEALRGVDYIAMELHSPVIDAAGAADMEKGRDSIVKALCETHTVNYCLPMLYARKHHQTS